MTTNVHVDDLHERFINDINQAIDQLTFGNNEAPRTRAEATHNQPRYRSLVVAYDGRSGSELALDWAKDIAATHGAKVTVASVFARPELTDATSMGFAWYPEYAHTYAHLEETTRKLAEDAVERLREAEIEASPHVVEGSVVREIADVAAKKHADIVIVGSPTTGRVKRTLLGSVATGLLGAAPCSILIARTPPRPARILAATDGSHVSYRAVAHALHRASATGAELIVQHVINYPEEDISDLPREGLLKSVAQRVQLPAPPPKVRYVLDVGEPAVRILLRAGEEDVGLIVLGSHGKGVLERMFVGSTSRRVANGAHESVLIVRAP